MKPLHDLYNIKYLEHHYPIDNMSMEDVLCNYASVEGRSQAKKQ